MAQHRREPFLVEQQVEPGVLHKHASDRRRAQHLNIVDQRVAA
jgi:hypothetical protein